MRLRKWAALFFTFVLLLSVSLTLASCGKPAESSSEAEESDQSVSEPEEDAEYPVTVEGVTVPSRPSRVVSLSPSLTEKLYDMALDEYLVGVSDHCDYPVAAKNLPSCGTAQLPKLDEIKNLKPHLILVQAALPEEDLISLQQMNIDVVVIPLARNVEQLKESYRSLATLLEGKYTGVGLGEDFAERIQGRLDLLAGRFGVYARENGEKDALFLRLLDFNVATGDTLENELMELIGLNNIASEKSDWIYPASEASAADGRAGFEAIDVIFMDEKFVSIKMLEQSSFYKGLQATLKDWYLYIDSIAFERQSLRMLDTLEEMAKYAYPEA